MNISAMISIAVTNKSPFSLPSYQTLGASGLDLQAHISESISLPSLGRYLFPTGLYLEIPLGYEAQIRPRSGLALKYGITCLNTPGTIDSDYRGELKILLVNLSKETYTVAPGDRIAQLVFAKIERIHWKEIHMLSATERAEKGFGHTGN